MHLASTYPTYAYITPMALSVPSFYVLTAVVLQFPGYLNLNIFWR